MMDFSDLTILITCYNSENYLTNIEAVLDTAIESKACAVIVDDGSTDRTLEKLKNLSKRLPQITIIDSANLGSASARNLALQNTVTRFGVFLDADDRLNLEALSNLLRSLKNSGANHGLGNFLSLPKNTLGAVPKGLTDSVINSCDYRDELFRNMGYWRYIYDVRELRKAKLNFEPTFAEVGSHYFILDDAYFLMKFFGIEFKLYVGDHLDPFYNYNVGEINKYRWNRYLKQVKSIPLASRIVLRTAKQNKHIDLDWFCTTLLNFTFESTNRLPLSLYISCIPNSFRFAIEAGPERGQPYSLIAANIFQAAKNSIATSLPYKVFRKKNKG